MVTSCGGETPPCCKIYSGNMVGREGTGAGVLEVSYPSGALSPNLDCSFYLGSGYFKLYFNKQFFFQYDFF